MGNPRPCCVPKCADQTSSRVRLPTNNPHLLAEWIRIIGNPELEQENVTWGSYRICLSHFSKEDLSRGTLKKLKVFAVPTLNIPVQKLVLTGRQAYVSFLTETGELDENTDPSTREAKITSLMESADSEVNSKSSTSSMVLEAVHEESPEKLILVNEETPTHLQGTISVPEDKTEQSSSNIVADRTRKRKRNSYLRKANVTRQIQLNPQSRLLYKQLLHSQRSVRKLTAKTASKQQQLKAAEKAMQSKWFNRLLKTFSSNAYNFWMMQFRNYYLTFCWRKVLTG